MRNRTDDRESATATVASRSDAKQRTFVAFLALAYRGVEQALKSSCFAAKSYCCPGSISQRFQPALVPDLGPKSNLQMWCPTGIISET
jgi:hypothetical protein